MSSYSQSDGNGKPVVLNVEQIVGERYSSASQAAEPALCCPVEYDGRYLSVLPSELIERDYGCGDPSKYVGEGETVLDLGSGGGKICYIASQIVGPAGRVVGVDMNDDMLALARGFQAEVAERIGHDNVTFYKGRIQDLAHDVEAFDAHLAANPVRNADDWHRAAAWAKESKARSPMIADDSIDVVLSNCVLNLVTPQDRRQLFDEVFRVLKRGGRAVISDIVCDEPVPQAMKDDPNLWSGCISGAFLEHELLAAFESAGFYGLEIVARQQEPWAVIEGIEFRSMTVRAFKGKEGPCDDYRQAVVYRGPFKSVVDDDGHVLNRGVRTAVCEKTFRIYSTPPYADDFIPMPPNEPVTAADAVPFDCRRNVIRDPRETKGKSYQKTQLPTAECCGPSECC